MFSKWAEIAWDARPKYALGFGSKDEYERGRSEAKTEKIRSALNMQKKKFDIKYDIRSVLPGAKDFSYNSVIRTPESSIVDGVMFLNSGKVEIYYNNTTSMRIKPRIEGYVFTEDGIILGKFTDSWTFSSLDPREQSVERKSIVLKIPKGLELSRWASAIYKPKPRYFYLAGSSKKFDEIVMKATHKIKSL